MKKNSQSLISGQMGFLIGVASIGISLVVLGISLKSTFSPLIMVIGGAIFGTCFTSIISQIRGRDILQDVKSLLKTSLHQGFNSYEEKLENYRRKWHLYTITEKEKGLTWRHTIIDFSSSHEIGKLTTEIKVKGIQNEFHGYSIEAGLRDCRFVIFVRAIEGDEPTAVHIFPLMGFKFVEIDSGLVFFESWKGNRLILPCIIKSSPLDNISEEGDIPKDKWDEFNKSWEKGMSYFKYVKWRDFVDDIK